MHKLIIIILFLSLSGFTFTGSLGGPKNNSTSGKCSEYYYQNNTLYRNAVECNHNAGDYCNIEHCGEITKIYGYKKNFSRNKKNQKRGKYYVSNTNKKNKRIHK